MRLGIGLGFTKGNGPFGIQQMTNGDNEAALMGTTFLGGAVTALDGVVARSTAQAAAGTASAEFTANSATATSHYVNFGLVPADKAVRITGKIYLPTGSFDQIKVLDSSDGSIDVQIANAVRDTWVDFSVNRAAKGSAWPLVIGNNFLESKINEKFYLDSMSIRT